MNTLKKLGKVFRNSPGSTRKPDPRIRPNLEALEDRQVPAILTDLTQVAQMFPRHPGPTNLYLNFDGYAAQGMTAFQTGNPNREANIQEVLFRTSQIFAPFDVQVQRRLGNGGYATSGGSSTVFVGDSTRNGTGPNNTAQAWTPAQFTDYPKYWALQGPNTNAFDIAYVDPVFASGGFLVNQGNSAIAEAVAHEAGHTFGLGHVLSAPSPDTMSYNSANTRFINQTFNLTDLNWTGTQMENRPSVVPHWTMGTFGSFNGIPFQLGVSLVTQNSFSYLRTVLGDRPLNGDLANVADPGTVDSSYLGGNMPVLAAGASSGALSTAATIDRPGDYDVFRLNAAYTGPLVIQVNGLTTLNGSVFGGIGFQPVVMVFDATGFNRLAINDLSTFTFNSEIRLNVQAGASYRIVVGAPSGLAAASYQLAVSYQFPVVQAVVSPMPVVVKAAFAEKPKTALELPTRRSLGPVFNPFEPASGGNGGQGSSSWVQPWAVAPQRAVVPARGMVLSPRVVDAFFSRKQESVRGLNYGMKPAVSSLVFNLDSPVEATMRG